MKFARTVFLFLCYHFNIAQPQANPDSETSRHLIYSFTETMPTFPGGNEALAKFIRQNLQYPQADGQSTIHGRVSVKFIVQPDGRLTDISVVQSLGPTFDAEAVRVVKMMPRFNPGYQNGLPVSVYYNIPFLFKR